MIEVRTVGRRPCIKSPLGGAIMAQLRQIPGPKKWVGGLLSFEPSAQALDYVREQFPGAAWTEDARALCTVIDKVRATAAPAPLAPNLESYVYKTIPFAHQQRIFELSRGRDYYALLMEMGTGKTKIILDTAAYLWAQGKVQGLLVIAFPNGAHVNWVVNECPVHIPDWCPYLAAAWDAQRGEKRIAPLFSTCKTPVLRVLTMNIEALSTKRGEKLAKDFLCTYPSLFAMDESTCIKTPSAKRTKAALRLGTFAPYRRILTGTPVTKGPLDLYTQLGFLDEEILGYSSFYAFRAYHAIMRPLPGKVGRGGRPIQIVVGYQNLDELQQKLQPHSSRVLKKDCLDLPEKLYQRAYFDISEEQRRHYTRLKDEIMTEFEGRRITAPLAVTKLLRLHQVACGFLPDEDPKKPGVAIGKSNPRLELLLELLENIEGKAIIWATYRFNLREIWKALTEKYGVESCVAYHGEIKRQDDRTDAIAKFQDLQSKVRFFIAQPHSAGYCLTLTAAGHVIYYSNDYALETRLQSEDRAHRIGQDKNVTYIDLEADDTVDSAIITALRNKRDLASTITGDELLDWLK